MSRSRNNDGKGTTATKFKLIFEGNSISIMPASGRKPAHLLYLVLRFSINFLTVPALSAQHHNQVLTTNSNAGTVKSEYSSVDSEQMMNLAWDSSEECGDHMPSPVSVAHRRLSLHVTCLLMNYLSPLDALSGRD